MRSRFLTAAVLAVAALGAPAASASAAKVLWLDHGPTGERAPAGTAVEAFLSIETCALDEAGKLATDGKPSDKVTLEAGSFTRPCETTKWASSVPSVTLKPAGEGAMTVSLKATIHVFVEPWCVYSLPKTIAFPPSSRSVGERGVEGTLDKAASFGTCPPTHTTGVYFALDDSTGEEFTAEVVG